MRYFKNPFNGYMEASKGSLSWLFALLWLEIYLLAKGNYRHFLMVFFLNLGSIYILALPIRVIYAFMIGKVNAVNYLRKGWIEVADPMQQPPVQQPPVQQPPVQQPPVQQPPVQQPPAPQMQKPQQAEPETPSSSST